MKENASRAAVVKSINVTEVILRLSEGPAVKGREKRKTGCFAVIREFQRPWKVRNPQDVPEWIKRAQVISRARPLRVAMEPTGTYGDPVREALTAAGPELRRVGSKATSDYQEIFDGVPSAHEGKDAAVVAERPGWANDACHRELAFIALLAHFGLPSLATVATVRPP